MSKKSAIIVIMLLLLIPSVIAAPKPKEPKPVKPPNHNPKAEVNFTEKGSLGVGNVYLGNQEIINSILYVQDAITTGTFDKGDSPISGFEIQIILSGTLDLNTYSGSGNGKWIFIGQSGTFQGSITGNVLNGIISGQFVGHGTENFEGQKIKGAFEGSANSIKAEITIKATITAKMNTVS
jgi:hypothetical protein